MIFVGAQSIIFCVWGHREFFFGGTPPPPPPYIATPLRGSYEVCVPLFFAKTGLRGSYGTDWRVGVLIGIK